MATDLIGNHRRANLQMDSIVLQDDQVIEFIRIFAKDLDPATVQKLQEPGTLIVGWPRLGPIAEISHALPETWLLTGEALGKRWYIV